MRRVSGVHNVVHNTGPNQSTLHNTPPAAQHSDVLNIGSNPSQSAVHNNMRPLQNTRPGPPQYHQTIARYQMLFYNTSGFATKKL